MKTSEIFDALLANLKVGEAVATIASRRDEIAKTLNKEFRSKDGCTDHKLMVGSFGRHTAINGVSDLDMIFILPPGIRSNYDGETGPRRILNRVRDDLNARYPNTDIRVDQCVVRVQFTSNSFKFEVQPAFENADGSFDYPDTKASRWKITKPREEIAATKECNDSTSTNMRHLARMARAWKNTNGVNMGGLLIDTLVHKFFAQTNDYDSAGTSSFDLMARDFFEFLKNEPEQGYYLALGSRQHVHVKAKFQPKARKAYNRCLKAIEDEGKAAANQTWREVFGSSVPLARSASKASRSFSDTEEFIEDKYPIDISETVSIDCEVTQDGWRPTRLRNMLRTGAPLRSDKNLKFWVTDCSVEEPYTLKWKVLNRGQEAERRNMVRGQIVESRRPGTIAEHSDFKGEHVVECYVVKDGIVVARDRIDVPISNTSLNPRGRGSAA
ncbi:nucleotide-binding domain-containing protein [Nocardia rhizosphaerihabitans]|uniref:Nucleotidyltransferase n=1 Tax=Nocardia rhizosphaerihabitans TaxID=1691570 RepID=A0ABQ2L3C7_9NOCA|nr:nucleotidyltransferase [Nocardia rhizosphaerihabitans]GGO01170.1 nucleotidyltransferase [Nocardia rhizosphaerihabitans]